MLEKNNMEKYFDLVLELLELEGTQEEKEETFSIKELPDSFDKINQIASIIQNYPWDITIYITGKEKKVNAEWLELLKKL